MPTESPRRGGRLMTNRRMFLTMLAGATFRRRSRALAAMLSSAVGAATLFCLAAVCLAVPAQMTAQMRQFGANLIVVPVSADATTPRITEQSAQAAVQAAAQAAGTDTGRLRQADYRYETVRINRSPYLLAGINVDDVRRLNGHWSLEGSWPDQGQVLVGKDVAQAASLKVGSTVTAEYLSSDNLSLDNSHQGSASSAGDAATGSPQATEGSSDGGNGDAGHSAHAGHSGHGGSGGHAGHGGSSDGGATGAAGDPAATESAQGTAQWQVAGIVDTGGQEDDIVYAASADVDRLTGTSTVGYDVVEMSVDTSSTTMDDVVSAVESAGGGQLQAEPVSKITSGDTRIITMLNTLFWVVSAVVLGLTLVGVSTTMTVIVSERRNEIGLRKALGASGRSIATEFYSEAAVLGAVGGVLGTAVGYGLAVAVCRGVFETTLAFNWPLAIASVVLTSVVAVAASYSPVRRASRIDPALVLREE
ncbi:FtsX-like permease family protein [Actinomyces sp. ZJ308]|uniref:ABC transporter permease n=1 Tax=Actinomyces sp. ZJ308 TaxID=2708342 RepID=UPI001AB049FE|nr:FtsX-like permease family protein [Actinomyces sp. ZJ308]